MIKTCDCKHDYQDEKYGKGKRVMNEKPAPKGGTIKYVCTVCEKIH